MSDVDDPRPDDEGEGGAGPPDLGALLGGGGAGGGMDMGALLGQAMEMQQQLVSAQAEAAATEVEGSAGSGAVRIRMTGGGEFRQVHIDPAVADPDDVELLQDLVLAALRDATAQAAALTETAMGGLDLGALTGGLGLGGDDPLGALGLGLDEDDEDEDDDEDGG